MTLLASHASSDLHVTPLPIRTPSTPFRTTLALRSISLALALLTAASKPFRLRALRPCYSTDVRAAR